MSQKLTPAQALEKIKQLFVDAPPPSDPVAAPSAPPVEAFAEYKLDNGSTIMIDTLEVGGSVQVMGPDGNPMPAPAGQYVLETSQLLTVDEAGKIVEVGMVPEAEQETEVDLLKKKVEEMAEILAANFVQHREELDNQRTAFQAAIAAQDAKLNGLRDILQQFLQSPSVDPVQPQGFHTSRDERIAKFLEFTKSIK